MHLFFSHPVGTRFLNLNLSYSEGFLSKDACYSSFSKILLNLFFFVKKYVLCAACMI